MRIFPFLFGSFLPVAAIAQPSPNQAPDRTWITDVRIISPEKLDHIEKGSVLIENGRIVRVERKTGAKKPAGATVVSGEGQFLIPGLIDSHVQGILQTASAFLPLLRLYHARRLGGGRSPGVGRLQAGSVTPGLV